MAKEEAGSPEPLEELEEHRWFLVEEVEEVHSLEVVVVAEVGLPFLAMEEEVEQCHQGEEEEGAGVEQGHQEAEEEEEVAVEQCHQEVEEVVGVEVEVEEQLNQEVMVVEVEELALGLLVMVEEEVAVEEEVP